MSFARLCPLVLLLPGLFGLRPPGPDRLLQEGHAAFARGDFATAAELYERAEARSTDPAEVAFYLAGAKYRLALKTEGRSPELQEAEQLYRCCLAPSDPLRPRALCGLGNCLVRRAGIRDAAALRAALTCYDQCLRSAGDDAELIADARHNREKARLLLLQCPPTAEDRPGDKPPGDDSTQQPTPPDQGPQAVRTPAGTQGDDAGAEPRGDAGNGTEDRMAAEKAGGTPQPGQGDLPPLPEEADVPPLSPRESADRLERAAKKVLSERRSHRRRGDRPAAAGVKDW